MCFFHKSVLERIREKPRMHIKLPPYFAGLLHMHDGYKQALWDFAADSEELATLNGFDEWLASKFSTTIPPMGWYQIICDREEDDIERVRTFCELMIEYLREKEIAK